MSLFPFLKRDKPAYSDKVWKEAEYAIRGMVTDALQVITKNEVPMVLTFFTDTSQEVMDFLSSKEVPYFEVVPENSQDALNQTKVVYVINANLNASSQLTAFLTSQSKKQKLNFLFYGHYPIPSRETQMLEKLMTIPESNINFYSSLDDPSFKIFGADQIKSTLEKLGLANEEAIEHAMVSKAMKNAREKIEQNVKQEIICSTQMEWFKKNYKS